MSDNTRQFNCWNSNSTSINDTILRPWPKCGLINPPNSIIANVTYGSDCPGGAQQFNGVTFSKSDSDTTNGYNYGDLNIFFIMGITANQYDSSKSVFDFQVPCIINGQGYGKFENGCGYNYMTDSWSFYGGVKCFTPVAGNKKCDISITIIGIT